MKKLIRTFQLASVLTLVFGCGSNKSATDLFKFDGKKDVYSNITIYLNFLSDNGTQIDVSGKEFIVNAYLTKNDEEQQVEIANIGNTPTLDWKVTLDGVETNRKIVARVPFNADAGSDGFVLRAVLKGLSSDFSIAETSSDLALTSMVANVQPGTAPEANRIEISLASTLALSLLGATSDKYLNSNGADKFADLVKQLQKVQKDVEALTKTNVTKSVTEVLPAIFV